MIRLDTTNVTTKAVGEAHGLNLQEAFKTAAPAIKESVTNLYAKKDEAGGWKRWLNLGHDDLLVKDIDAYANTARKTLTQLEDVVILGIGGSSLGGFALLKALLHPYWNQLDKTVRKGLPRFHFIENVDSDQIKGLTDVLTPVKTLVNVITKSGTTSETMSAFLFFKSWLEKALGADGSKHHIVATTDKQKGVLREIADKEGYTTFEVPDDVGGRFSVFSAVGMLPAALCGVDIKEMQRGIRDLDAVLKNPDIEQNPAAQAALIQHLLYKQGKDISVFMPYSYRLSPVSDWFAQLWAESLGKAKDRDGKAVNVGPTPVRAVGVTDQHSQVQLFNEGPNNKTFTFVQVEQPDNTVTIPNSFPNNDDLAYLGDKTFGQLMDAEFLSTRASLTRNQRPNMTLSIPKVDAYHFAQLLYFLQVQTAIAGDLFNVDPFDQPGVEQAKKYTYALMGRPGYENLKDEAQGKPAPAPAK